MSLLAQTALELAGDVAAGRRTATDIVDASLTAITARDGTLNAFTAITEDRARSEATRIDADRAAGRPLGPLAGVPFAVKNLFDIQGVTTTAGSIIHADRPPAQRDGVLVRRLSAAGAVLMGALNMDEYAYGFTTENSHYGPSHNPHDPARVAGGSSGGSAAAVAGGLVPISLGSDTNGSIRVPSSLCGIFGLKPTYGRLPRTGSFPFVGSLDHLGPFARSVADLALVYDLLQGPDPEDPACAQRPVEAVTPLLGRGLDGIRAAVAGDYFTRLRAPEAVEAVSTIAAALKADSEVILPEAERARAAAFIITMIEGATLHLPDLKTQPDRFDPATRDRFLAGALLPGAWYNQAQRFRRWYHDRVLELFRSVDVIIAPATPCSAPLIGQETMVLEGVTLPTRANMGLFTQPISFIGLPVLALPVARTGLPIGVQLIAAPWREDMLFRVAAALEAQNVAKSVAVM